MFADDAQIERIAHKVAAEACGPEDDLVRMMLADYLLTEHRPELEAVGQLIEKAAGYVEANMWPARRIQR